MFDSNRDMIKALAGALALIIAAWLFMYGMIALSDSLGFLK